MSLLRAAALCFVVLPCAVSAQDLNWIAGATPPGTSPGVFTDVDGSGLPDCCEWGGTGLWAHLDPWVNGGLGQWLQIATPSQLGGPTSASLMGTTDLDADGNPELLIHAAGAPQGLWVVPTVNGLPLTPGPIVNVPVSTVSAYAEGDFNGDGFPDLAVATLTETRIFLRQVNPPIMAPITVMGGNYNLVSQAFLLAGDFDEDGIDDLILRSSTSGLLSLIRGDVSGTFVMGPGATATGSVSRPLYAGDFDGDGDVEAVCQDGASVAIVDVLPGTSQLDSVTLPSPMPPPGSLYTSRTLSFVDVDADGVRDLIELAHSSAGNGLVRMRRRNDQGASFVGATKTLFSSSLVTTLRWVDGDGDGDLDLMKWGKSPYLMHSYALAENRAIVGVGCAGAAGVPEFDIGTPHAGNLGFTISLSNAAPGAQVYLGVSTGLASSPAPCAPIIDVGAAALTWPIVNAGLTSATGSLTIPIPLAPGLDLGVLYAQFGVADPSGGFSVGETSYALSRARGLRVF